MNIVHRDAEMMNHISISVCYQRSAIRFVYPPLRMRKICHSRFSTRQTSLIKDGQLAVESDVMVCIDYRMMCGYQAAYQSASEMFATYAYVANMY